MSARSISMAAPFRWLMKAVDVGRRQPRALFGGFALMLAVGMIPSVVQLLAQAALPSSPGALMVVYGLTIGLSLVLLPPLSGAAFRLLHDCESGRPVAASDLFNGYRDRAFAVRMILTSALLMLGYMVMLVLLFTVVPGKEFFAELFARALVTPPGATMDVAGMPPLPPSFLLWLLVAFGVVIVLSHVYMLAFAQASLGGRDPLAAVGSGLGATVRNLLPLVGVSLAVAMIGFALVLILGVVLGLVVVLLSAVSPALAMVVVLPVYLLVILLIYVLIFGFYYHAWRDIFGEPAALPADALEA
ncbi:hypothetical protein [Arenimonas alkanexedens]